MFLSRIYVPWPESKSAYTLHQALWGLFPNQPDGKRDFLFRVEQEKVGRGAVLLMQSKQPPVASSGTVELQATRDFSPSLTEGQRIRFLLKANPIKTIKDERGRTNSKGEVKSCRVPLIKETEQYQWLVRKLDGVATLNEVSVSNCLPMYFKKNARAGKIVPVRFEGFATVTEPSDFSALLQFGVGPAKALGCGMLSIAPA